MTANQRRAIELAGEILADESHEAVMTDAQWGLLLLAAGLNHTTAKPCAVAHCVLANAAAGHGYFVENQAATPLQDTPC